MSKTRMALSLPFLVFAHAGLRQAQRQVCGIRCGLPGVLLDKEESAG